MSDMELEDDLLRQKRQYAGGYVAWLDGQVILSAETYGQLSDQLDQLPADQEARATVEYIEPVDVVRVYGVSDLQALVAIWTDLRPEDSDRGTHSQGFSRSPLRG